MFFDVFGTTWWGYFVSRHARVRGGSVVWRLWCCQTLIFPYLCGQGVSISFHYPFPLALVISSCLFARVSSCCWRACVFWETDCIVVVSSRYTCLPSGGSERCFSGQEGVPSCLVSRVCNLLLRMRRFVAAGARLPLDILGFESQFADGCIYLLCASRDMIRADVTLRSHAVTVAAVVRHAAIPPDR